MTVLAYPRSVAVVRELPLPNQSGTGSVPMFAELCAPRRWHRLGTSFFLHSAAILLLIKMTGWLPPAHLATTYPESVHLIAPTLEAPVKLIPAPSPKTLTELRHRPKPLNLPVVPRMEFKAPKSVAAPEPLKIAAVAVPAPELPKPALPKKITQGLFESASPSAPPVQAHAREIQTGGFGDPSGVAGKSDSARKLTIASAGSFDLPAASANESGAGKPKVISGSGFGGAVARSDSEDRSARNVVSTGAFAEVSTAQASTRRALASDMTPVEILYKPKPVYTAEARQLHIQGEVLLDVMFAASGDIRVLRVIRGLGHGLDQAAAIAGQQIRFQPAKRDGRPYDSDAVVHIVFELAE